MLGGDSPPCSSQELRNLYARALLFTIPLNQIHSSSFVRYEAMAMAIGKTIVATRAKGQKGLEVIQ